MTCSSLAVKGLHYTRGTNERPVVWSCSCGAAVGWAICLVKTRLSAVHNWWHQNRTTSGINLSFPTADWWEEPLTGSSWTLLLNASLAPDLTFQLLLQRPASDWRFYSNFFFPPDQTEVAAISFHYCFACHHCWSDFNSFESWSP